MIVDSHADCYFARGKTHSVCQDYARVGSALRLDGSSRPYAIVSDGCSGSPDTDIGARLLTLAAEAEIKPSGRAFGHSLSIINRAAAVSAPMLPQPCLDATLLTAHEHDDGVIEATVWGDGVLFAVTHGGNITAYSVDMNNMPSYLSYLLTLRHAQEYVNSGYGKRAVTLWLNDVLATTHIIPVQLTDDGAPASETFGYTMMFQRDMFQLVGVATDGVHSFQQKDTLASVPFHEVLRHVTDIRVPTGKFLERSSKFFLERTCPKLGWQHMDDFGVAAIWLGDA